VRAEAGPLPHRTPAGDLVFWRISRAHHGRAFADRIEAAAEAPLLAAGSRRDARPLSLYLSRMFRRAQEEEAFSLGCARYIEEKLFKTILPPEEVAAIFIEPIQGEGGYVVAPDNFLRELRRICNRHGILLVVDEVQCGAGRTGKWWAIEHSGVEPDMVCMAKGIASGMPLGICMTRAEIMDWVPGSHASTFGGNPVSIAAALATMDIIEREGMANAARVGEFMLERLRGWTKTHPLVGDVRGRG
jgi:4-aminobutyrate aminotransferase